MHDKHRGRHRVPLVGESASTVRKCRGPVIETGGNVECGHLWRRRRGEGVAAVWLRVGRGCRAVRIEKRRGGGVVDQHRSAERKFESCSAFHGTLTSNGSGMPQLLTKIAPNTRANGTTKASTIPMIQKRTSAIWLRFAR